MTDGAPGGPDEASGAKPSGAADRRPPDETDDQRLKMPPWLRDVLSNWATPEVIVAVLAVVSGLTTTAASSLGWGLALGLGLFALSVGVGYVRRIPRPSSAPTMPDLSDLVGRDGEIAAILAGLAEPGSHVSVVGRRGVGTSACASAAVRQLVAGGSCRPDRQLYLNVRAAHGSSDGRQVVGTVARLLGLDRRSSVHDVNEALSRGEWLLILDNVDQTELVRDLHPPVGARHRLLTVGTIGGAGTEFQVGRLDEGSAVALLRKSAAKGDPGEGLLQQLVPRCAYAPAVLLAAGELVRTNRCTYETLLGMLRSIAEAPPHTSRSLRLKARHDLAPMAEAGTDATYAGLGQRTGRLVRWRDRHRQRLFRRLALAPAEQGPPREPVTERPRLALHGLPVAAISAATRFRESTVRATLNELSRAQVLAPPVGDDASIQPELVTLARLHLLRDETYWSGVQSEARLLKHLAKQAKRHADKRSRDNQEWFHENHELLHAAVVTASHRFDRAVHSLPRRIRRPWFRLAVQLCVWYAAEDMADEWRDTCRAVEATPRRRWQVRPLAALEQAWLHNELAAIERRYGTTDARFDTAVRELTRAATALRWWQGIGKAQILTNQGVVRLEAGDVGGAVDKLQQAEPLRSPRDNIGRALTDLALGVALYQRARRESDQAARNLGLADARGRLVRAGEGFATAGELRGEAAALTNLVLVIGETEEFGHALAHADQAMVRYESLREATGHDDAAGRAALLLNRGAVLLKRGGVEDVAKAEEVLLESRRLRADQPGSGLGRTLLYLGDVEKRRGLEEAPRGTWRAAEAELAPTKDIEAHAATLRRLDNAST